MKNSTHKGMEFLGIGNSGPPLGNSGPPLGIRGEGAMGEKLPMPNALCPMPNAQCVGATIPLHLEVAVVFPSGQFAALAAQFFQLAQDFLGCGIHCGRVSMLHWLS